jgi:predicted AAA+ superfamily ATPase
MASPYLARHLLPTLQRGLRTFPCVILTGARQTGKTTLLRHVLGASHRYVSLERPDVRQRALSDPVGFLTENATPVILDEIQLAPGLLPFIKDRVDEERKPGSWVLTGSQTFPLMAGVSETLAGRAAVLTLSPLSMSEVAHAPARTVDEMLTEVFAPARGTRQRQHGHRPTPLPNWLLLGGYPEIRTNKDVDRQLWFSGYVQTYLQRDVRDVLAVGDLNLFSRLLSLLAARTGTTLNMVELGRDLGISGPTVKRWLSVLEASQIIYLLPPYHRNLGKRLTKSPKLYFTDPGLATFLMGLHQDEPMLKGPTIGALVETAVVGEWLKLFRNNGELPSLYFWRTSAGLEVDLLIERERMLYGMEIKTTATPIPQHADNLKRWMALAGTSSRGVVACQVDARLTLRPEISAVPWHLAPSRESHWL